jgi:2-succinyl-5-enolpyruvyl-6-hydroxy-3-cyclohexene-1-carboxylate synthase
MNISLANKVLQVIAEKGVTEIVLCAGARNSPFIYLLENQESFKLFHFFEERSAAFFALGRAQSNRQPIAVITTSGTAASELLPAAIEAFYGGQPLLLITADRPFEYRGTGAPQSIDQVGIYSNYARTIDINNAALAATNDFGIGTWDLSGPLHLNVCFREPLIDEPLPIKKWETKAIDCKKPKLSETDEEPAFLDEEKKIWKHFCTQSRSPLVIVGTLKDDERNVVHEVISKYSGPIYFEALSGLRGHSYEFKIMAGEHFLKKSFNNKYFDGVIRIGGIPTTRIWRDLEDNLAHLPVLSLCNSKWTGLSRMNSFINNLHSLPYLLELQQAFQWDAQIRLLNRFYNTQIQKLLTSYPSSEPGMIHNLSKLVKSVPMYLGNSLPIREWDEYAVFETRSQKLSGNRGANGIDGQVSTYLGWSKEFEQSYSLFGDLTTLYDLSSLWVSPQIPNYTKVLTIMNNGGGIIFDKIFGKEIFLNRHKIQFKNWANMWNWNYSHWQSVPDVFNPTGFNIIELQPDSRQTKLFYEKIEELWKKEI